MNLYDNQIVPQPNQPTRIDVPGKLSWFKPGTGEYKNWAKERSKFIHDIDAETPGGREILNDILDCILESEIPKGIIDVILISIKITKKAREMHKRKLCWHEVVNAVLQMIFIEPTQPDDEFVFKFHQIERPWSTFGGNSLSDADYKKLYYTIDTKLRAGKLKNMILKYPELDRYTEYKLRQFKDTFHQYQVYLIEH